MRRKGKVKRAIRYVAVAVLGVLLAFAATVLRFEIGTRAVLKELAQAGPYKKLSPFGSARPT